MLAFGWLASSSRNRPCQKTMGGVLLSSLDRSCATVEKSVQIGHLPVRSRTSKGARLPPARWSPGSRLGPNPPPRSATRWKMPRPRWHRATSRVVGHQDVQAGRAHLACFRLRRLEYDREPETRALPHLALDLHCASHRLDQQTADGQAQSRAAKAPRGGGVGLGEGFEDVASFSWEFRCPCRARKSEGWRGRPRGTRCPWRPRRIPGR